MTGRGRGFRRSASFMPPALRLSASAMATAGTPLDSQLWTAFRFNVASYWRGGWAGVLRTGFTMCGYPRSQRKSARTKRGSFGCRVARISGSGRDGLRQGELRAKRGSDIADIGVTIPKTILNPSPRQMPYCMECVEDE